MNNFVIGWVKTVTDVFSKAKRSKVMSLIRGKENKATELALIGLFKNSHITGWRRNQKLFGKPDFVFKKEGIAVFVDGCFWHGCPIHETVPKTNMLFWVKKINTNKKRDKKVNLYLRRNGWKVVRIWQHEIKKLHSKKLLQKALGLH
jgi:DNA mismatch endonuclease (patch repair protein)